MGRGDVRVSAVEKNPDRRAGSPVYRCQAAGAMRARGLTNAEADKGSIELFAAARQTLI